MKFVEDANLPLMAASVIIGEKYAEILREPLKKLGIEAIPMPDNPQIDRRLSGHADISVLHLGGDKMLLAPYLKNSAFAHKLRERGFRTEYADIAQAPNYPDDAQLNICAAGKYVIYSKVNSYPPIVNYFTNIHKKKAVESRQGYARCSSCVVNSTAIITSDGGIYRAAIAAGMDVLKIRPGYIELPGFDYGFIGGAAFKISNKTMAFTGNLDAHPDKAAIIDYLGLHNIEALFLTDKHAFDIGSAIPAEEK